MVDVVTGDLITMAKRGDFDVVCHGCNCFHTMGKGIAKKMKKNFPECYQSDINTPYGDIGKMGTNSYARHDELTIVNCYTQHGYGYNREGKRKRYEAIWNCLTDIKERYAGKRIGIPQIGCFHAGGEWDFVFPMIEEIFKGIDNVTIVIYGVEKSKSKPILPFL